ncbi:hypothetical protein ZOD2009_22237 [Haladaptatus paucihalophilus DX253]|uniref:Uncharacterized protein n=1 Tax=Haladaptatus paucihalophilus DX253 TaxID=797209 RepID=E7R053_HALPU|nr:hypothetical protein [Haladaptatus paucihalophilus]EFW89947.1 hypothetical protein ZOD2009_22237 [Haladaptatus paucihalophilus DX253]SHK59046.1 hypothetical protein SAMN05444342_1777 [Haladaptatus paucihalophilus DX253]
MSHLIKDGGFSSRPNLLDPIAFGAIGGGLMREVHKRGVREGAPVAR